MIESKLRIAVGLTVVLSHLALLILIIALYVAGGFLFEEMTTTVALIIPMFGIYATAVIRYIVATKALTSNDNTAVTTSYAFISFLLPILFVILLAGAICMKAFNIAFANFEQFKIMLGVLETAFGAYMGIVLSSMFDVKRRKGVDRLKSAKTSPPSKQIKRTR